MLQLVFRPELHQFDTVSQFAEEFAIGEGDLVITNEYIYQPYFGAMDLKCDVLYQERYGKGEPNDEMVEAMIADMKKLGAHRRVIGIGGGTVLDISKLFALKYLHPIEDLYDRKLPVEKDKELVLVPTTCGTGSEVTNIAILAFLKRNTKFGLADDAMYADKAVLIPEFLENLPYPVFATSSIDALVHAVESSLSPKATPYTKLFGYKAIEMILNGYVRMVAEGKEARIPLLNDFLIASNFAGLAFGTAGCAAVHAMSYPLGGTFHVAHGESNYAIFKGVIKNYLEIKTDGAIAELAGFIGSVLGCSESEAFDKMFGILDQILTRKTLKEYGADDEMMKVWTNEVMTGQQRLMRNNFVPLDADRVLKIYRELYEN